MPPTASAGYSAQSRHRANPALGRSLYSESKDPDAADGGPLFVDADEERRHRKGGRPPPILPAAATFSTPSSGRRKRGGVGGKGKTAQSWRVRLLRRAVLCVMGASAALFCAAWIAFLVNMPLLSSLHPRQLFASRFRFPSAEPSVASAASPSPPPPLVDARRALPPPLPQYTASNVTFFTVYIPELGPPVPPSTAPSIRSLERTPYLHHLYALHRLAGHMSRLLVFTSAVEHCLALSTLSLDYSCRVTPCFPAISANRAPLLRCLLEDVRRRATTALVAWVEDEAVVFGDFVEALAKVGRSVDGGWVMVGGSRKLRLKGDAGLDTRTWHEELLQVALGREGAEADPSNEGHNGTQPVHYFAYRREHLPIDALSPAVAMERHGVGAVRWQQHLLSRLLVHGRVKVVDASASVVAVDLNVPHVDNETLTNATADPTDALGSLSNSDLVLTGKCPTCALRENREVDLALTLIRRASSTRHIVLIALNAERLPLVFNFLCRASELHFEHFLFLAEDRFSYRVLRQLNAAALVVADAPYKQESGPRLSLAWQRHVYALAVLLEQAIQLDFNVTLLDLDVALLDNPLTAFESSASCDVFVYMRGGRESTALLHLRAGELARKFLVRYVECERDNLHFVTTHGQNRFFYSDEADNTCAHFMMKRLVKRNALRKCELRPPTHAPYEELIGMEAQERGIAPVMAHLELAPLDQVRALQGWGLWRLDEARMMDDLLSSREGLSVHCALPQQPAPPAPTFDERRSFHLTINVLASTTPSALTSTLSSLAAASYEPGLAVLLSIVVQQPLVESLSSTQLLMKTMKVANDFQWQWGEKRVHYVDAHLGETGRWLDTWQVQRDDSDADGSFQLALSAGHALSERWFDWLRRALHAYFYDPFNVRTNTPRTAHPSVSSLTAPLTRPSFCLRLSALCSTTRSCWVST